MKKLSAAIDRFCLRHPGFGIPGLMRYIVIGNVIVYLLSVFAGAASVSFLAFDWAAICRGELWRLVTFIFMPGYTSFTSAIWMALFLYLYYTLGTILERQWGTAKFTFYYLSGVALTVLTGVIGGLVFHSAYISGADSVNQSLFFAFAVLFPETQFYVLFIPVKVKWLAWLSAAMYALSILLNLLSLNLLGAILPIIALLNFFVYFWDRITGEVAYRQSRARHQTSRQTIHFKSAVRDQRRKEAQQGYRHKCAVCGRTDAEYPDLEFRYCSRCEGYHCFCQDHIFNHVHFTQ